MHGVRYKMRGYLPSCSPEPGAVSVILKQPHTMKMFESGVWIFVLESALALAVLVFIVWWTLPSKHRPDEPDEH